MSNVKYDVNQVIQNLASEIAALKVQLAHSNAMIQAQAKRIKELEKEEKAD